MRIPFSRTLKQTKTKGLVKTVALILATALKTITEHLKYRPEKIILEINRSKMMVFPRKGAIHADLFLYKKREPLCTDYLINSGVIKKNDVVLDIGANIGYYALLESRLVGNGGKVYGVEPVCSNFELLEKNVKLNNLSNVATFQLAFGENNTKAEIFVSDKSNLCAMNKEAVGGEILGLQNVTVMTVDEFVKDKSPPNFIRMDVEGYEYEIIKGMPNTLKDKINILLELHPLPSYLRPEKLEKMFQILEENRFRAKFVVYERKVEENLVSRLLFRKAGENLPFVASNISIQDLKKIVYENAHLASPNILFEKVD
ncbi:MAG: FkbM family methyltransferase [Candidatus Bathyarchaeota archaeon]|nr:FkbM family methyltransferase [Candidatus Bathyarchaeota archaeon]